MMKRGQPYLGAFLFKYERADANVITNINSLHLIGVFARLTVCFLRPAGSGKRVRRRKA
jgi:Lon-like ATP-dependent protease